MTDSGVFIDDLRPLTRSGRTTWMSNATGASVRAGYGYQRLPRAVSFAGFGHLGVTREEID